MEEKEEITNLKRREKILQRAGGAAKENTNNLTDNNYTAYDFY